jgi:hypothetical protein
MSRLERWSRRKRNVHSEEDVPATSLPATARVDEASLESEVALDNQAEQPQNAPESVEESTPEPGSLDHTLPDPDTLEAGSDFSAFMLPGVSGALRRKALKRLWATGNYNVRDGLDDYDLDYRQQLKPMAAELASKLRRWTHKAEEAVDKRLDDSEPESQKDVAASEPMNEQVDEQPEELEEASAAPCANNENIVKNPSLDDQSDYLSGTKTKI